MFKRIRVAILLYILAFIALGNFLAGARSTDWDETLWVDVYPINADGSARTQAYVDGLTTADFEQIETYFSAQGTRYGVRLDQPFRLELGPQIDNDIPQLASTPSVLNTLLWSLKMRWFAIRTDSGSDRPDPDIKLFALYHEESAGAVLDRSTALERGLIAVAELFAGHSSTGANQIVMAHELLHTLGATDKYDLGTNLPIYPHGYANPEARPLYPQRSAELMAGRVPLDERTAEIPTGLQLTVVGPETAAEIGWSVSPR
jgi:hypothetical protein